MSSEPPTEPATDPRLASGSAGVQRTDVVVIGSWFGLVSGVLIAGIHTFRRVGLGQLVWNSHDVVWMAPLAQLLLLGMGALLLAQLDRLDPRLVVRAGAVILLGFLGAFSVLLLFGGLARWAAALVALGVALQAKRTFYSAPDRWRPRLLSSGLAMVLLVAGIGLGLKTIGAVERARLRASLPPIPSDTPNILLVILDTVRRDHLSLYGYSRPTSPALERWAASSAVFERALSTSPWTLPSHGTLFTGQMGSQLGGDWKVPIQGSPVTLGEVLRNRGYATSGFAANLLYVTRETGLSRGLTDFSDYPMTAKQVLLHSPIIQTALVHKLLQARSAAAVTRTLRRFNLNLEMVPASDYRSAAVITDGFLDWQARQGGRPFFGVLNYFDAHAPYRAPEEVLERFGPRDSRLNRYDAAISYLDSELNRMFMELERRGVLDRTIVVVTADHGELFGEHGMTDHANALYLPLLRVPLIIRFPPRVPPGRITGLISLRDVPPTILGMAGVEVPSGVKAGSLLRLVGEQDAVPPSAVVSELSQGIRVSPKFKNATTWLQSATDDEHHYIRNGLGAEELFRWSTDSLEQVDLADLPESAAVLLRFRARVDSLVGRPN